MFVPTVSLYEVFKRVVQQRGESAALQAVALMQQGQVVELSSAIAPNAARLSLEHRLPMVDSMMLATAQAKDATLWTQDAGFEGIAGVEFRSKQN